MTMTGSLQQHTRANECLLTWDSTFSPENLDGHHQTYAYRVPSTTITNIKEKHT